MKQWKKDVVFALVMLGFSIYSIIYSIGITDPKMQWVLAKADTYVILWTSLLAILSVILLIKSIIKRPQNVSKPILTRRVVISAAIIVAFVFLIDKLGFMLSSALFVMGLLIYYTYEEDSGFPKGRALAKRIVIWIIITGVTLFAVQYLFGTLLGVNLPKGIFEK